MYFYKATTMNTKQLCDTVNHDTSPNISICVQGAKCEYSVFSNLCAKSKG